MRVPCNRFISNETKDKAINYSFGAVTKAAPLLSSGQQKSEDTTMAKNNNSGSDRMERLINDRRKIIKKLSDEICENDESESYLVAAEKINQIKELEKDIKTLALTRDFYIRNPDMVME